MNQVAQQTANTAPRGDQARSLVAKMAEKFGVDGDKFMATLKSTAFKQRDGSAPTNEQMMALMVVSDQYGLNPFTKEIYAFPDRNNGIVPVVGVDGWSRIINQHKQFDGVEFRYSETMVQMPGALSKAPEWIEAVLYRKDRSRPTVVREYLDECYKPPGTYAGPWQTHPKRFLRHKALIQGGRIGFGFVGIYDQDEAENIIGQTIDNASGQVIPMAPKRAAVEMSDDKYEQFIETLIQRGKAEGCWPSIIQLLDERFQNNPALLQNAKQRVNAAELETLNAAEEQTEENPEAKPAKATRKAKPGKSAKSTNSEEQPPVGEYPGAETEAEQSADNGPQGSLDMG
ncbi:phage recombination protein Bet [Marinobacter salicampi]|uniref:phage recombination protein Bet n=1 Tax=Marinobacter salicampi TaxID=435907 RepID=UPI00140A0E70|nr:phage recombination protein Bet [Marinobacter salicampi]